MKDEMKISVISADKDLKEEIENSLQYFSKYCLGQEFEPVNVDNNPDIIFLDLCETKENTQNQENLINYLIGDNAPEELPPIIILGNEEKIDYFDEINGCEIDQLKIQLLTELCSEYYDFFPIPFSMSKLKDRLNELLGFKEGYKKDNSLDENVAEDEDHYLIDVSLLAYDLLDLDKVTAKGKKIKVEIPVSLKKIAKKDDQIEELLYFHNPELKKKKKSKERTQLIGKIKQYIEKIPCYQIPEDEKEFKGQLKGRVESVLSKKLGEEINSLYVEYYVEVMHALEQGGAKSPRIPRFLISHGRKTIDIINEIGRRVVDTIKETGEDIRNLANIYEKKKKKFVKEFTKAEMWDFIFGQGVGTIISIALSPGGSTPLSSLVYSAVYFLFDGFPRFRPNPFRRLREIKDIGNSEEKQREEDPQVKNNEKEENPSVMFFKEVGKYANKEKRERRWKEVLHRGKEGKRKLIYCDLAIASVKNEIEKKPSVNILLIENAPSAHDYEKNLKKIKEIFLNFHFWKYQTEQQFKELYKFLEMRSFREKKEKPEFPKPDYFPLGEGKQIELLLPSLEKFDLILIDIFLGDKKEEWCYGDNFLRLFTNVYPNILAFVVSCIEDYELVKKTIKMGADNYIPKEEVLEIPYCYFDALENYGKLITLLKDKNLRRNLLGNIRYWKIKKEFLWFGDKCYHMINHSFEHTMNDWSIANQLLYPLLQKEGFKYNTDKDNWQTPENLYALSMGIWLHDIGHKGSARCGEVAEIRDKHGVISGEWILTNPLTFSICDVKNGRMELVSTEISPYELDKKPVTQLLQERIRGRNSKALTVSEKIALISIYHKSNAPLTKENYDDVINKRKYVPNDFFKERSRNNEVITLSDILGKDFPYLLTLAAIFRFIDGIDINKNRVGDYNERSHKTAVIDQDKKYQLKKLKKEVDIILRKLSGDKIESSIAKISFRKQFYDDVIEKIERGEFVITPELLEYAKENAEDFEDYFLTATYASFISVQAGHFDLHSSITKMEIKHPEKNRPGEIEIHYDSNKNKKYLQERKVLRAPGERDLKTIEVRIVGTEQGNWDDGYVMEEFKICEKWLKDLFKIKGVYLHSSDKVIIGWKEKNGKREKVDKKEERK